MARASAGAADGAVPIGGAAAARGLPSLTMRLAVYTDYPYHRRDGEVYAERAFALFLARMGAMVDRLVVLGRLAPGTGGGRYPMGREVEHVALPYYPSLAEPWRAGRAMARSLRALWRGLDGVDCVWLLGPHPLAFVLAAFALARRRRIALGVRQDLPAYAAHRHPDRRPIRLAARLMDGAFRLLARRVSTVVVGPQLAERYAGSRRLLEIAVTLIEEEDIVSVEVAGERSYAGELTALTVGRIDPEKNPLMLADILEGVSASGSWRLIVCGEGSLEHSLAERLERLGLRERAELRGYVPHDELAAVYRQSHVLLHVSWTEGLPQVLFEAFAAGLPVVATAVGGIPRRLGGAARLIPPGDAGAAARALQEVASDPRLRARLVTAGNTIAREHTLERSCRAVVGFLRDA